MFLFNEHFYESFQRRKETSCHKYQNIGKIYVRLSLSVWTVLNRPSKTMKLNMNYSVLYTGRQSKTKISGKNFSFFQIQKKNFFEIKTNLPLPMKIIPICLYKYRVFISDFIFFVFFSSMNLLDIEKEKNLKYSNCKPFEFRLEAGRQILAKQHVTQTVRCLS